MSKKAKANPILWPISKVRPHPRQAELFPPLGDEEFKDLMAAKARFIVPATLFFVLYYFALPVLVGYAPQLMTYAQAIEIAGGRVAGMFVHFLIGGGIVEVQGATV